MWCQRRFIEVQSWCASLFPCFQMAECDSNLVRGANLFPLNNSTSKVWQFWIPEGEWSRYGSQPCKYKGSLFLDRTSSKRTSFSLLSSTYLCRYIIWASVQHEIGITFLPHAMILSIYYYMLPYTAFLQLQKLHEGGFVWEHTSWKAVLKAGCIINSKRAA